MQEVEMATSVDDLKTSWSMFGNPFPDIETLDAKIFLPEEDHPKIQTSERGLSGRAEGSNR